MTYVMFGNIGHININGVNSNNQSKKKPSY